MVFTLFLVFFTFLLIFMIVTLSKATYLINQAEVVIIERLGSFHKILTSGLHFVMPFVDQPRSNLWTILKDDPRSKFTYRYNIIVTRIDLRETVYDFPRQSVITKDNVTIEISVLLYYQITDPKAAAYEVADLPLAIEKLTQTTMRNIIGSMDLDETLTSRDKINERLRHVLDDATEKWGVKVNRVELQEIIPPVDIRQAMEKQMRAERDRRALILEAEGQKSSAILSAEGDYQSKVTRARGEAEARLVLAQAEADAIEVIKKAVPGADPLPYMIAINYIKTLPEITKGKDDKIILMPYEATALMGSVSTIKELFNKK
jgi:regulator of protease activity HflC (stomatin/prohibitin superfamily)